MLEHLQIHNQLCAHRTQLLQAMSILRKKSRWIHLKDWFRRNSSGTELTSKNRATDSWNFRNSKRLSMYKTCNTTQIHQKICLLITSRTSSTININSNNSIYNNKQIESHLNSQTIQSRLQLPRVLRLLFNLSVWDKWQCRSQWTLLPSHSLYLQNQLAWCNLESHHNHINLSNLLLCLK